MICKITFKGFSITIKRVSKDEIELSLPIFFQPKIEGLEIGKELSISLGSLASGVQSLFKK